VCFVSAGALTSIPPSSLLGSMPKIVDRVVVRERIDPGITASLFSNYRSSADSVLELIDNSVDSRIAGRPLASRQRFIQAASR
jgi:hypothetical protein